MPTINRNPLKKKKTNNLLILCLQLLYPFKYFRKAITQIFFRDGYVFGQKMCEQDGRKRLALSKLKNSYIHCEYGLNLNRSPF